MTRGDNRKHSYPPLHTSQIIVVLEADSNGSTMRTVDPSRHTRQRPMSPLDLETLLSTLDCHSPENKTATNTLKGVS